MKLLCILALLSIPVFAQSSNGSGCVANGTPSYCNKAFTPLLTDPANTNAQTQVVVPAPAFYSTLDIHSYLYSGNTTRALVHYQPWFCNTGTTCNSHINIGYNENSTTTVTAQLTAMKALGFDVVVPDYYGNSSSKAFNLATVDAMASIISGNPSAYPKMLLGMDSGAWSNSGQCPQGSGITTSQMEACIETQLDYAASHYFFQSWYETFGGKPIVTLFLNESSWPSVDWTATYTHMHAHVAAGQSCGSGCTYTSQVLLLGRNSGAIPQTGLDGAFAWSPTQTFNNASPGTQLQWNGTSGYLDNFYATCRANPSKLCIGLIEKGFDDSNASFGTGKVIAQQCGQLPKLSADKIGASGYSSSSQLPYAQLQTWNDMEEGTGIENGLDNCYRASALIIGNNLNWTLTPTDATYANLNTISKLQLVSSTFSVIVDNITPALSGSVSLVGIAPGQSVYLRMIGKSMILNQLSNALQIPAPSSPATGLFASKRGHF